MQSSGWGAEPQPGATALPWAGGPQHCSPGAGKGWEMNGDGGDGGRDGE